MRKIGRNEPCPCGSGKKYKKCCIDKPSPLPNPMLGQWFNHWTYEEVNEMTTEEIIQRLGSMGISFDQDVFVQNTEECYWAQEISESWFDTFEVTAEGRDEDFPWFAAWVLWERLAPTHNVPLEQMSELFQEGIDYLSMDDPMKACDIWLRLWEIIKDKCKQEPCNLVLLDERYHGAFFVSNFCQDLEEELNIAGFRDNTYFQKRIDYCREFLTLFADEDESLVHNMRRSIAESYAKLADYEQSDSEFEKLVQDYSDNPWGYIGWGDMYLRDKKDRDKAKELYIKALAVADKDDIMVVQERLEDIGAVR